MDRRYRRRTQHPRNADLFFWRYERGREVWVTKDTLNRYLETERSLYPALFAKRKIRYHADSEYRNKQIRSSVESSKKNRTAQKKARDKWLAKPGSIEKSKDAYNRWVSKPEGRIVRRNVTARYRGTINGTMINRIRSRIWQALKKGFTKSASTLELVGCSMLDFRQHIEKQFPDGMSWDNVGVWEIDHITPLSAFDLSDPSQQRLAFRYTNCRPLWKNLNRQKSDKIEGELFRGRDLRKIVPFKAA